MKNVIKLFSILFLVSGVVFNACNKPDPLNDPNDPANWTNTKSPHYRPPVTGVTLTETDTLFIEKGKTATLVAKIAPENAFEKGITWESNEESIATVDNSGVVKAEKIGNCKITVRTKEGNFTASRIVVVVPVINDHYAVEAIAGVLEKATGQISDGWTISTTQTPPFALSGAGLEVLSLIAGGKNTSGEIIPAGTPVKYRLKFNGTAVEFTKPDGSKTTEVTGTLVTDIAVNGVFILYQYDALKGVPVTFFGEQEFCLEILQFGKKDFASMVSDCGKYKVQLKDSSIGSTSRDKSVSSKQQVPSTQTIKANFKVK